MLGGLPIPSDGQEQNIGSRGNLSPYLDHNDCTLDADGQQ